jgi:hypothetical protein
MISLFYVGSYFKEIIGYADEKKTKESNEEKDAETMRKMEQIENRVKQDTLEYRKLEKSLPKYKQYALPYSEQRKQDVQKTNQPSQQKKLLE